MESNQEEKPTDSVQLESNQEEKPTDSVQLESNQEEKPTDSVQLESNQEEKPTDSVQLESNQEEKPTDSVQLESNQEEKPTDSVQLESNQEEKPTDSVQLESNQEEKPTDSVQLESGQKEEEIVIQKIAEGSVDGQVACAEGPVRNATVSIGMISTFSDSKGNFLLEHVPPGIGKIRAKSPISRFYDSTFDVLVETDKRKNVYIFLAEVTGTVEGTIADETGKPLVGAEVSGPFRLRKDPIVAKTDENGHYIFAEVPHGSYYIRAKAEGYMLEGARVNVVGANTALTNFTLKPGGLSITGKVLSKEGAPIDCDLFLMRKGIIVTKVRTSSSGDGRYSFSDLVPDTYEVTMASPNHKPKYWTGKLEKNEVMNFELEAIHPHDSSTEQM